MCFCSQDYYRNKGCIYHILNSSVASVASGRSSSTHFFFHFVSISEHSSSIGICIKKGEKSLLFIFLSAKGAEGVGGGQSLSDMSAKKSILFYTLPKQFSFLFYIKKSILKLYFKLFPYLAI